MTQILRQRRLVLAVAGLVAAAIAAVTLAMTAFAGGSTTGGMPAQFAPAAGSLPAIAGDPGQVLSTLASRLPLVSDPSVAQETIPAAPDPGAPGQAVQGLALSYDLSASSTSGGEAGEALWQGDLFVGAVADEFAARGLGTIVDAYGTVVTPDGTREPVGGGVGHVVPEQIFNPIPNDIGSTVSSAASSIGLHSVQVQTLNVLQDALVIHAVSDSPASDIATLRAKGALDFLLGQHTTNFEGVYLEIDDSAGNPVYELATAPRDGAGSWWAAPSLGMSELPRP